MMLFRLMVAAPNAYLPADAALSFSMSSLSI
jgi:hypothetical protein